MKTGFLSDYVLWATIVLGYSRYDVMTRPTVGYQLERGCPAVCQQALLTSRYQNLNIFCLLMDFHDTFINLFAQS